MTDAHAHLDACDGPAGHARRARARRRGHADRHHRHRDRVEPRRARRSPTAIPGYTPLSGSIRTRLPSPRRVGSTSCASSCSIRRRLPWGRRDSTLSGGFATREQQRRLFEAHLALADDLRLPVVDSQPRSRRRHRGRALVVRRDGGPPLLLVAGAGDARSRAGLLRLVRGQRDVSEARRLSVMPLQRSRRTGFSSRRTARTSRRSRSGDARTSPPMSSTRSECSLRRAARTLRSSRPGRMRTQRPRSGSRDRRAQEGARAALPRRREHPRSHRPHERPRRDRRRRSRSARGSES